ncbi:nitrous oxide reductase family maturation protein NosD [Haloplanus aerogenes]|uniref:Nitrous oxidase accessory protein n=1 Tax=Haloplanus aerogenes TaxID=660522 RepID=A0A3M0CQ18_9EURY|nr:nitrous oxide reductase family maturation protein NosD [Haloplanus aerogenes]AZH25957.1 nitrous oxide reductase family maturation protein NosD [Haloplanus aerogenes]RMB11654.1 nitrous oxidase accessory protein [Haloplanus aerogenes]
MNERLEYGFAVVAVATVVLSLVAVVAAPTAAERTDELDFDPGVPDEYSFTPPTQDGTAEVDGQTFDSAQAAVVAAEPGETVTLRGRLEGPIVVNASDVTVTSAPGTLALVEGTGEGDILTINGQNVTVDRVWVRNSGYDTAENDAGIWVNGTNAHVVDSRVTNTTFGVWIDGVDDVRLENNTIVGRESIYPFSNRGNGIQIWKSDDSVIADNRITDVRDGIYYSWASNVLAHGNTMWDLRYGVHYMYSDDNTLRNNLAFDNDVGYALMVSKDLTIVNNTAINNTGQSGHGILVKSIDRTAIRNNTLVRNDKGLYVYNSLDNVVTGNLVLENHVGVHLTAGSVREEVHHNSFIKNDEPVRAVIGEQVAWNESDEGNYWSGAKPADVDGDGVSEARYQPAGTVERLAVREPRARLYTDSPAFAVIRLAESSIPVIETPGVVDHHPLATPPHEDWRRYYE